MNRLGIVGPGALGCLLGALAHRGGIEVLFLHHSPQKARELESCGVEVTLEEETLCFSPQVYTYRELAKSLFSLPELWLIATKATALATVTSELSRHCPQTPVVSILNGLEVESELWRHYSPSQALQGITFLGAHRLAPGRVLLRGRGPTYFPKTHPLTSLVCELWQMCGLEAVPTEKFREVSWTKALLNAAINPLTAILRVPNGELLGPPHGPWLVQQLLQEGTAVAQKTGVELTERELWEQAKGLLQKTAPNHSSMFQDLQAGRLTEIEYFEGALLQKGRETGVETPLLEFVYHMVRFLEGTSYGR